MDTAEDMQVLPPQAAAAAAAADGGGGGDDENDGPKKTIYAGMNLRKAGLVASTVSGTFGLAAQSEKSSPARRHRKLRKVFKSGKHLSTKEMDEFLHDYREDTKRLLNLDLNNIKPDPGMTSDDASLTFRNVSFSIKIPDPNDPDQMIDKTILESCSGHFEPGTLVALMGPSGCGKSTLLDILARKKTAPHKGTVYVNGHEVDEMFSRISSYVGQSDIMPEHWTVKKAVEFTRRCKKPVGSFNDEQIDAAMDQLLDNLGLLHVKDTKIGGSKVRGVSGGQRRRVSLGRGISAGAQIMFCDEPTSGLSATDAELCIRALKLIAKLQGLLVIVVIHQPRIEVAQLFDTLVMLTAQPGRVVYNGPMKDAVAHWEKVGYPVPGHANPSDHFLDLISPGAPKAKPEEFVEAYKSGMQSAVDAAVDTALASPGLKAFQILQNEQQTLVDYGLGQGLAPVKRSVYGVSFCTQLKLVMERKLWLMKAAPMTSIGSPIIGRAVMGFFLGCMYQGKGATNPAGVDPPPGVPQVMMVGVLLVQVAQSGLSGIGPMLEERAVMKAETSDALYGLAPYIISMFIVNLVLALVGNSLFFVSFFFMCGLDPDFFAAAFLWTLLAALALDSIVGFVAAVAKDMETALTLANMLLGLFCLFGGVAVTKVTCASWMKWFFTISPLSYCMENIMVAAFQDVPSVTCIDTPTGDVECVENPEVTVWMTLQSTFGYEDAGPAVGLSVCAGVFCFFRMLQVYCLKYMHDIAH